MGAAIPRRKTRLALATFAALLVSTTAAAGSEPTGGATVTADDALHYGVRPVDELISEFYPESWFPDSRRFAFSAYDDATSRTVIYIGAVDKPAAPLTDGDHPVVSPDGRSIAFLKGQGLDRQIWVIAADRSGAHAVTHVDGGLHGSAASFAWSPDSTEIALSYTANFAQPRGGQVAPGVTVVVYGSVQYTPAPSEIWLFKASDGASRKLATIDGYLQALSWSPKGDDLIVYQFQLGSVFLASSDLSRLLRISHRDGQISVITSGTGEGMLGAYSPAGDRIAWFDDQSPVRYPAMYSISVMGADGGGHKALTPKIDGQILTPPSWSPDGSHLYYTTKSGVFSQVFRVDMNGRIDALTRSAAEHGNLALAPDGKRMLFQSEEASGQRKLVVADADGGHAHDVFDYTPYLNRFPFGDAREIRWKSVDGLEMAGLVVLPPDFAPGRRYPLIVDLHGGPIGGIPAGGSIITSLGPLEREMWAAKGYVVLSPDYRSDGVAGWDPIEAARQAQDFMDKDFTDIMGGVDAVIAQGWVDPNRMVVGGHSYGGVLTNWVITHTHRFRAAVSYEGGADWYREYGSEISVGGNTFLEWQFMGKPWDVPDRYLKNSSLFLMKGVTTPTLFIVGGGTKFGSNEPTQYEFLFTALRQQNVDTEMLRYENESHAVFGPANVRDLTHRIIDWVDRHEGS